MNIYKVGDVVECDHMGVIPNEYFLLLKFVDTMEWIHGTCYCWSILNLATGEITKMIFDPNEDKVVA